MSDIVIIGGGVAGLSAGIYALRNGHRATICEKHIVTGGNLTAWNRQGYTVDACIHWLTGTNPASPIYGMWEQLGALGEGVEIYEPSLLFTVEHEGETLSLYRDLDKTVEEMLRISPEDKRAIMQFKNVVMAALGFLGTYGPGKNERPSFTKLIKHIPALVKYFFHSTGEIEKEFKHPLLKKFICSLTGRQSAAVDFAFVAATFTGGNADLPMGLSKPMAERMTARFLELGGTLLTGKEAVKLNRTGTHFDSVTFKDGSSLSGDIFIAAMDPMVIFRDLTDVSMPKALKKQYDNPKYTYFSSAHVEYICDLDTSLLPFEENFFVNVPTDLQPIIRNRRFTLREFSQESSFSKYGKSNLQVMVYLDGEGTKYYVDLKEKDKEAYRAAKTALTEAVTQAIYSQFPCLFGTLTPIDCWTPATFKRFTGADRGTYMAFMNPKLTYPKKLKTKVEGTDNLYSASQWMMAPGGLPAAASCGRSAIKEIDGFIR